MPSGCCAYADERGIVTGDIVSPASRGKFGLSLFFVLGPVSEPPVREYLVGRRMHRPTAGEANNNGEMTTGESSFCVSFTSR